VLRYLLIFYVISPEAVFRNNVNERRWQWSQKMIAELNTRPLQAVWVIILALSGFKTVVFYLWRTTVIWLIIKPSHIT